MTGRTYYETAVWYFGEKWDAPLFDDTAAVQVATPVGQPCLHCTTAIEDGDRGFMRWVVLPADETAPADRMLPVHRECDMRAVIGGLDHVQGRCEYTGHCNELREQAGRSLREDALAVWDWIEQHRTRP